MIIVNFYKGVEKVFNVYALSVDDVINDPKAYYPEYTSDMIITEQTFTYPILDSDGKIREMTRAEQYEHGIEIELQPGELIQGGILVTVEQPSRYHEWLDNKWVVDLDKVRLERREVLKSKRDALDNGPVEYGGYLFKMELEDIVKFMLIGLGLVSGTINKDDKREWILYDNSTVEMNNLQLFSVLITKTERTKQLFQKFTDLQHELNMAKTVEEIEAIVWEVEENETELKEELGEDSAELKPSFKKED